MLIFHTDNLELSRVLISLIESIVLEGNKTLQNPEDTAVSSSLNNKLYKFQLFTYRWVLKIHLQNDYIKPFERNLQSLWKGLQSPLPMKNHDNRPTDQKNYRVPRNVDEMTYNNSPIKSSPNPQGFDLLENLNFGQLRFRLAVHRWISSLIIHRTLGKTAFGRMMPILRNCKPVFPRKEAINEIEKEIEKLSDQVMTSYDISASQHIFDLAELIGHIPIYHSITIPRSDTSRFDLDQN
ncbi:PREDICTED: uncharacterized protein LOC108772414 [Cyphomyrmex costatus]|uniref:uncharacterized protein LOC108772414 n=1 Tax=Cyphomyrmex costatus TaxID=456900 RepID=UPI00085245FF|nr:PREDICTED: uncharacterized protein LOC108772414 [Cyphomyrmex costatus]